MVSKSFSLSDVFESVWNDNETGNVFEGHKLSTTQWENVEAISTFLKPAAEVTELSSSSRYVTVSLRTLIFDA